MSSLSRPHELAESHPVGPRFGAPTTLAPRLGQGAFRIAVSDAYSRRCAVTGEKVLPALDAARIRPYAQRGDHRVNNGLLMRRDLHGLFDRGYLTLTRGHRLEVSRRIKEDFDNGRNYYALHGSVLSIPGPEPLQPDPAAVEWHNQHVYLG